MVSSLSEKDAAAPVPSKGRAAGKKAKKVVADSWEDEDVSDNDAPEGPSPPSSLPPPTSTSTSTSASVDYDPGREWTGMAGTSSAPSGDATSAKRPEKTDAVARRMIAAGLGLKAPKQTEEQKAYQKAIREQEKKKREQERAEEQRQRELTEKAKAAIWDD